jgi:hypothetical protein
MANLPLVDEDMIRKSIKEHWSQFGKVIDVAPHRVYGKWLSRRWDLLLEVEKGKKITAPVAFELCGRPVVTAWPSSPPSCLICNTAGHSAKKCPKKNPKFGAAVDPVNKVVQPAKTGPGQKRASDVVQGTTASSTGSIASGSGSKLEAPNDQQIGVTDSEMISSKVAPASNAAEKRESYLDYLFTRQGGGYCLPQLACLA